MTSKECNEEPLVLLNIVTDRTPGSATRLLNKLQWSSLEQRQKEARLIMFYKAVKGKIALLFL